MEATAIIRLAFLAMGLLSHVTSQATGPVDFETFKRNNQIPETICPENSYCIPRMNCPLGTIIFDSRIANGAQMWSCGITRDTKNFACCRARSRDNPEITMLSRLDEIQRFIPKSFKIDRIEIGPIVPITGTSQRGIQQRMFQEPPQMERQRMVRQRELLQPQFDMFPSEQRQLPTDFNSQPLNRQQGFQRFVQRFQEPQQQFHPRQQFVPIQFSQQLSFSQLPQQQRFPSRFFQQPVMQATERQDFSASFSTPVCGMPVQPRNDSNQPEDIAAFGEMPWMAAILIRDSSLDSGDNSTGNATRGWVFKCSAVLIHPRLLLTTASCVDPPPAAETRIHLGGWNLNDVEPSSGVDRNISHVFVYPSFNNPDPGMNDLAIVEMGAPVNFSASPNINPICLTPEVVEWRNSQCVYAAWNYTSSRSTPNEDATLRKATVRLEWGSSRGCFERLRQKKIEGIQGTHCYVQMNSSSCLSERGGGIFCKAPPLSRPRGVMLHKLFLAAVVVQPPSCSSSDASLSEVPGQAEETFPHMGWMFNVLSIYPEYPNIQPVTLEDFLEESFGDVRGF